MFHKWQYMSFNIKKTYIHIPYFIYISKASAGGGWRRSRSKEPKKSNLCMRNKYWQGRSKGVLAWTWSIHDVNTSVTYAGASRPSTYTRKRTHTISHTRVWSQQFVTACRFKEKTRGKMVSAGTFYNPLLLLLQSKNPPLSTLPSAWFIYYRVPVRRSLNWHQKIHS